jgi:hypothetical protein
VRLRAGTAGGFRGCQERDYRAGDGIRGSPGQVMTGALDELQAGIGQGAGDPAGGIDGNQCQRP